MRRSWRVRTSSRPLLPVKLCVITGYLEASCGMFGPYQWSYGCTYTGGDLGVCVGDLAERVPMCHDTDSHELRRRAASV
jgi:hypothetical protein